MFLVASIMVLFVEEAFSTKGLMRFTILLAIPVVESNRFSTALALK
jgi:hypothetical protein